MQRIEVLKEGGFLQAELNTRKLNEYVKEKNRGGWKLVSVAPVTSLFGRIHSYILLMESIDREA